MSHVHWVVRGTGTPKESDEVNRVSFECVTNLFVYHESLKRELKTKKIYGYRCDERLIKLT